MFLDFQLATHSQGRHTRLAIVLLQKNTNIDDTFSSDRLSTLATKCDINPKMIFVLPYNDNLMGKYSGWVTQKKDIHYSTAPIPLLHYSKSHPITYGYIYR